MTGPAPERLRRPLLSLLLPAALLLALAGCGGEDKGEEGSRDAQAGGVGDEQAVVATRSDSELGDWLSPKDPIDTGRWLASREAGRLLPNDDAASAQMRRSLGRAKSFFIEDPRMIANRTVQLGGMLDQAGKGERFEDLLAGLTRVAQGARGRQLYGEMVHHYFNTRQQGSDRDQALAKLGERYGSQREGLDPKYDPDAKQDPDVKDDPGIEGGARPKAGQDADPGAQR